MINFFDLFVLVVAVGFAVFGFREGLIRGAIQLAGFILLLAGIGYALGDILEYAGYITVVPRAVTALFMVIVFFVVGMAVVHAAAGGIHRLVHLTPAGIVDRTLGCAFGIIKALFLTGFCAVILSLTPRGGFFRTQYEQSVAARHLSSFVGDAVPFVTGAVKPYYKQYHQIIPAPEKPDTDNDNDSEPTSESDFI